MDSNHIIQIVLTLFATLTAYIIGRKKNKAEVRQLDASATVDEISATEKAISIWRGLAEELRSEVSHLRDLVHELKQEIDELRAQNEALREEMRLYNIKSNEQGKENN